MASTATCGRAAVRRGGSPAFELQTPAGRVLFIQDPDGNVIELKGRENAALEQRAADAVAAGGEPTIVG